MKNQPSLTNINGLIIDMDGVLWRDKTPLPKLAEFFAFLRTRKIVFCLATNNSSKTPAQYVQKFAQFGVDIAPDEVMTSALATAAYLKKHYPPKTRIFVIGQDGICQAITSTGFTIAETEVTTVVVGLDFNITYNKIKKATMLINQGAEFIGTNPDLTYPVENGVAPGNGAILAAITAATNKNPLIVGKPGRVIFEMALKEMGTSLNETAMLGDRLETDILGGQQVGLKTILVLSGITQVQDLTSNQTTPDWVFKDISALLQAWS